jgi:hypothetical protein
MAWSHYAPGLQEDVPAVVQARSGEIDQDLGRIRS